MKSMTYALFALLIALPAYGETLTVAANSWAPFVN